VEDAAGEAVADDGGAEVAHGDMVLRVGFLGLDSGWGWGGVDTQVPKFGGLGHPDCSGMKESQYRGFSTALRSGRNDNGCNCNRTAKTGAGPK